MRKLLTILTLLVISGTVLSEPHAIRDNDVYHLTGYTALILRTEPIQAFQPVYMWRDHFKFDRNRGPLGANAQYIGETDHNGVFSSVIDVIEDNPIYCGKFENERFSVGGVGRFFPKSNALSFRILDKPRSGPGPHYPPKPECIENN